MSSENIKDATMNDVMNEIDKSMERIESGDILKGKVISVNETEALVNIGFISDGILSKEEVSFEEVEITSILKPNDEIDVYVLKVNDGEGNVLLSKKRADSILVWDEFEAYIKENKSFEVKVKEVVKGGVVGYYKGLRWFIPASQISIAYVENLNEFIGKELTVKVIELDKDKNKIVLSSKIVQKEEEAIKKEKVLNTLKKGEKREGIVKRLTKFGAFVDLGGVDGLIRLGDLSWKRVNHPSEVVSEGDNVEVYVLDFDKKEGKISLGLKDVNKNPWNEVNDKFKIDSIVEGKIVKILDFGAFVQIDNGVEGLVHISQISEDRISKPSDVLNLGDTVKVKILDINKENQKMSLSIKEAKDIVVVDFAKYNDDDEPVTIGDLLKDKLKDFKF